MNDDLISRKAALLAFIEKGQNSKRYKWGESWKINGEEIREVLDNLPSVQPTGNPKRIFKKLICEQLNGDSNPYYSIQYIENGEECIGYSSYNLDVISSYLKEDFGINTDNICEDEQNPSEDKEKAANIGEGIVIIKHKTDGSVEREMAKVDEHYEVMIRYWETSGGDQIREWTADEYINWNPQDKKIIPYKIADKTIDVEAHCLEIQNVYATKNGKRVTSFFNKVDYSKDNGCEHKEVK